MLAYIALAVPALVLAQECGEAEPRYLVDNFEIVENVDPGLVWSQSGDDWNLNCDHFNCNNLDSSNLKATLKAPYSGVLHTGDTLYILIQRHTFNNGTHLRGRLELANGEMITGTWTAINTDWITVGVSSENDNDQLVAIYLDATTFGAAFDESFTFLVDQSYFMASCNIQPGVYLSCPLVQNAGFSAADGWLLDGTAVITDDTLTLASGDIAAQNLATLESNKTYNAVISATGVTAPASLSVFLGTQNEALDIQEPGLYTATLDTPTMGGPIIFGLQNDGDGTLTLDYACVSLDTGEDGQQQGACLAPVNGTFDTSAGWDWYRDARWNEAAENAFLPFNEGDEFTKSLLMSTSFYTMPVITGEQHILLSFEAETANDQSALLATTVDNGPSSSAGYFEVYPDMYTFELDLSTLAGETGAAVAFANAGVDPVTEFSAEDDIFLDNVCIFLADRGPRLPGPTNNPDPGAIGPIEFNYNFGCADAAGILASWGINMNLYHQIYGGTGTSGDSWFSSWWNWLMAGFWVMLEALLCFLLTALAWVIRVIEYGINNFLNVASWIERQGRYFLVFISALWTWALATVGHIMAWWWASLGNIMAWLWQSGLNVLAFIGSLYNFLVGLVNGVLAWLLPFFQAVLHYISPLRLFVDLVLAIWDLFWMLLSWIWANVFVTVTIPITFYYAFNDGVQTSAFAGLMGCADTNFWCGLLAGTQLVNQTIGHTVLYPIVIVGIILATIAIFWRHIWALFSINIR
ncbi:MAG: hypothetical protein BroJett011_61900 [Chloroflexota bacterium]|nr:MAG: hypothetical protein BroJett011_61900 [Chloroflexota bacterium]